MNHLHIYPTARGVRQALGKITPLESFSHTYTTIADFETKAYYIPQLVQIDKNKRVLFFKEHIDASLFTKSDTVFKLFEELSFEGVSLEELLNADSYAEYEQQITELITLRDRYENYLKANGMYDRAFVAKSYRLSSGYIDNFDSITLYLDGYLTKFERTLFYEIARNKPFYIELEIDRFSKKNIDNFKEYDLKIGYGYRLDLSSQKIVYQKPLQQSLDTQVYVTSHSIMQTMFVFDKINALIDHGIAPESIAVILPDEQFKTVLKRYDRHGYLNFAMGFDYTQTKLYKTLHTVYKALTSSEKIDQERFKLLNLEIEIENIKLSATAFLQKLAAITPLESEELKERIFYFQKNYAEEILRFSEFLYLFLNDIKDIRVDDVGGGKVTVIGALESRAVEFEGVVIVDFNEGSVPKINQKDIYLNSKLKARYDLPTSKDREELQKHLYFRLLANAKKSYICFHANAAKSKFLYELGLDEKIESFEPALANFYKPFEKKRFQEVEIAFDPHDFCWSSTMLKTYLECKAKFYYRYIKGIKEPLKEQVNEGELLHKILARCETFTQKELAQNIEAIAPNRYFEKLWKERLVKLGRFFQNHEGSIYKKEFKQQKNIEGLEFAGVVDRIDSFDDGSYLIIDYKSGKIENRERNLERLRDFQMPIYELLFAHLHPSLAYFSIYEAKLEPVKAIEQKREFFFQKLHGLKQTKQLQVKKCEDLTLCRYCPYTLLCQRGEFS